MIKSIKNNWFVILFYFALISSIIGALMFFFVPRLSWEPWYKAFCYMELIFVIILWGAVFISFIRKEKDYERNN